VRCRFPEAVEDLVAAGREAVACVLDRNAPGSSSVDDVGLSIPPHAIVLMIGARITAARGGQRFGCESQAPT